MEVMQLTLSSGDVVLLDPEDYAYLSRWRWKRHGGGYAARTGYVNGKFVLHLMHRLVMDADSKREVHHLNGNKLDNRKCNLALIDPTEHRKEHAHLIADYQKQRQQYPDQKNCANCGNLFDVNPRKRKRHKCCSKECAQAMRVQGRKRQAGTC